MKTSAILFLLSLALAVSAAPQNDGRQRGGRNRSGINGGGRGNSNKGGNGRGNNDGSAKGRNNNANNGNAGGVKGGVNGGAGAGGTSTGANDGASGNGTKTNSTAPAQSADPQTSLTLDPRVIAKGFANDGQGKFINISWRGFHHVPVDGQIASLTSTNNFINFCLTIPNLPLTNGKQVKTGSCNPAPMGAIPSTDNMPSAKFTVPKNGDTLKANTPFTISMAISNMQTGAFVNAADNYFAAPQQLNAQGQIIGHSHVVVETLTALDQTTPLDPAKFAYFKGLNAAAAGGILTADVTKGLPAGVYKLSSINSAANHQPVLVPVAQHGSLDDVVYFTLTDDGKPAQAAGGATTIAGKDGQAKPVSTKGNTTSSKGGKGAATNAGGKGATSKSNGKNQNRNGRGRRMLPRMRF
ncbi:hypothetical protein D9615_006378 [Tricholomella constricta]|uniref:Uncharacterized protein n=1 Tax=Tricholomella constricta TaxID=117010 RepID=A0A8H5H5V4_9AGAR|nr:hypothetical protein D9615_006378 [Tricholomella constricta]